MAQLALAIAGAAVGSFFGMPQLGFAIGSMIGGAVAGPRMQGPRLDDLTVSVSTYGAPVPHIYGSDRVSCPAIWSANLVETSKKSGGKGGPKVTTYSYSLSFAVLIAEGEISGLRRVWLDAKCVYDARDNATSEMAAASAKFRTQYMTFYAGDEAQSPDPTIEAVVGAGKVPALRGISYLVFTALPLEKHGNRMPQVSVEVSGAVAEAEGDPATTTEREPLRVYGWAKSNGLPVHALGSTSWGWVSQPTSPTSSTSFSEIAQAQADGFTGWYPEPGRASSQYAGPGCYYTNINDTPSPGVGLPLKYSTNPLKSPPGYPLSAEDSVQYAYPLTVPQVAANQCVGRPSHLGGLFDPGVYGLDVPLRSHAITDRRQTTIGSWDTRFMLMWRQEWYSPVSPPPPPTGYGATFYGQLNLTGSLWSTAHVAYMLEMSSEMVPYHPPRTCRPGNSPFEAPEGAVEVQGDEGHCVLTDGSIVPNRVWSAATGTAKQLTAIEYRGGLLYQNALGPVVLSTDPNYSDSAYWDEQARQAVALGVMQGEVLETAPYFATDVTFPVSVSSWYESNSSVASTWDAGNHTDGAVTLSSIVSHVCIQAGLSSGQIDVTELTDDVIGFTRTQRMAARAALEPLSMAFQFDAVESGTKIVFRKRGRASSVTIPATALGAGVGQGADELIQHERGQESELPDVVTVAFKDPTLDYQINTAEARRQAGYSDQQSSVELPVVMESDKARQVADVLLYQAWAQRTRRTISTTLAYSTVEPTDVVTVQDT